MKIKTSWVTLGALAFLFLPFLIFCLGFLKLVFGIPFAVILIWIFCRLAARASAEEWISIKPWDLGISLFLILIWVWLSGIGGFAFQNFDHHARNAIFRDLINYSWPVYYSGTPGVQWIAGQAKIYTLVYYIGYWLPAALVGKAFGWLAAEIALFLWTYIGIFLAVVLIQRKLKTSLVYIVILMIFFSGMDVIGVRYKFLPEIEQIYLTPPIKHLEIWAKRLQYSSISTQLFWVFNQAIPAWICMALHIGAPDRKRALLLWALCFFFAPLPAVGFLPLVLLEIPSKSFDPERLSFRKSALSFSQRVDNVLLDLKSVLTLENLLGGGIVLAVAAIYFLSNRNTATLQFIKIPDLTNLIRFLLFLFLEWFFLWGMFFTPLKRNAAWYVVGISLLLIPFFHIGSSDDFCMRASIPSLFMLMVWLGEGMAKKGWKLRPVLFFVFIVGAVTPIYGFNRSVYRTVEYALHVKECANQPQLTPLEELDTAAEAQDDHPCSLVADNFYSLSNFTPQQMQTYIGRIPGTPLEFLFKK